MRRAAAFFAVLLTALSLVPTGAHVLEIGAKLGLGREDYLAVQQLYRGWDLSGVVLVAALLADAFLALTLRGTGRTAFGWAIAGAVLMAAMLAVFFAVVFPVNGATVNWTVAPPDWQSLRLRWEFGHVADAAAVLAALLCVIGAATATAGVRR